jgi:hypothetical protein
LPESLASGIGIGKPNIHIAPSALTPKFSSTIFSEKIFLSRIRPKLLCKVLGVKVYVDKCMKKDEWAIVQSENFSGSEIGPKF